MRDNDDSECDVVLCVGVLLLSLGVAAVGVAYLFPYVDHVSGSSARETERLERRSWTVWTACWSAGLVLIALSVVVITGVFVYTSCPSCQRWVARRARDSGTDVTLLSVTRYGSSDSARQLSPD